MGKILDYQEMLQHLECFNPNEIKKETPIGYTETMESIPHYTAGYGPHHVIITAGTHATELIGNCFLISFMEDLSCHKLSFPKEKVTLHFLPIMNPEGTMIVTEAIRSVLPREASIESEQLLCQKFYQACREDGKNSTSQHWDLFHDINLELLKAKNRVLYEKLIRNLENGNYPKGGMIDWTSNGNGIDLNSNISPTKYLRATLKRELVYATGHRSGICMTKPGPYACPTRGSRYQPELETRHILHFYQSLIEQKEVIGSVIYHACGGEVIYLDEIEGSHHPWGSISREDYQYNKQVAQFYATTSGYKLSQNSAYTTMDAKLKTMLPGTILVELAPISYTPLGQFINQPQTIYDETMEKNKLALLKTVNIMSEIFTEKRKESVKKMYRSPKR